MSDCQRIQDKLADYRTGLLNADQCRELEAHLAECEACAHELEVLDSVLEMVESNTPEYEPPVGLWNGVYNQITDPTPRRVGFTDALRGWFAAPIRAAGVGLAALAIAAGLIVSGVHHDPTLPSVKMAAADEYVQGHALYASQASTSSQAVYLSMVAASSEPRGAN